MGESDFRILYCDGRLVVLGCEEFFIDCEVCLDGCIVSREGFCESTVIRMIMLSSLGSSTKA